jgi:hypothetical protein
MTNTTIEINQINTFLDDVVQKVGEGMEYIDAIQLTMLVNDGEVVRLASISIDKYQEATYEITELSKQENVDECALASMGTLWHGENFEGNAEQMSCTLEETFLDSLYFILKYAESKTPLEDALKANDRVCGDKTARAKIIQLAFPTNKDESN